ncbi:MAG: hypothetical protein V3S04_00555 [Candidatus Omnitrophota bacterium]
MKAPVNNIDIEVLLLPHASNLADFDPLTACPDVNLRFIKMGQKIGDPHAFILPGTRNTLLDFQDIKKMGYTNEIRRLAKKGRTILGIGGGFQMLGTKIIDIKGSEYRLSQSGGLGFFQIVTRIMVMMVSHSVEFKPLSGGPLSEKIGGSNNAHTGFETHLGRTKYLNGSRVLFNITKRDGIEVEVADGAKNADGNIFGTYIHRLFENRGFREGFIEMVKQRGLS